MGYGGSWRRASTISNQAFSERSGHSVWAHLCFWFCCFSIQEHNVTVSLNSSSWLHWLHRSGVTYNISHPQNNSASAWANHMMTTGSNMVTPYWALLRRLCKELHLKKNKALLFWALAYLPNSILMFHFYQQKSNANAHLPLFQLSR